MKKQFATIIMSVAAILVLTAVSANAQSRQTITVNIPFEFTVAGETYAAGEYKIGRLNPMEPAMLILKKKKGNEMKIFSTQNLKSKTGVENLSVVFSKSGDSYSLSEIWTGGIGSGRQTIKSKNERKAQQLLKAEQEKVVLKASLQ
jgi:hypothetical protein